MRNLVSDFKGRTLFGGDVQKRALVTGGWIRDNVKGCDLYTAPRIIERSNDKRLEETWIQGAENRYTAWKS